MSVVLNKLSFADFLAWEETQDERHEFYRGEAFAMAGGTRGHNRVIVNLTRRIDEHLDGTPCKVYAENMKLQIADDGCFYPDLMVRCGPDVDGREPVVDDPLLIIEVLSPSTHGYDRRNKFVVYRRLASLREYVLIDPGSKVVETYVSFDDGSWRFTDQTRSDELELVSIGCKLPMDWVFKGVEADVA